MLKKRLIIIREEVAMAKCSRHEWTFKTGRREILKGNYGEIMAKETHHIFLSINHEGERGKKMW